MAQLDNISESKLFSNYPPPNVPRSKFNNSFIHSFTMDFMELHSFLLYDMVPNDDVDVECTINLMSFPLDNPMLTGWTIDTWFFYVPYYLLWHKFDRFIFGGRDGKFECVPPYIGNPYGDNALVVSRLGALPTASGPGVEPSAIATLIAQYAPNGIYRRPGHTSYTLDGATIYKDEVDINFGSLWDDFGLPAFRLYQSSAISGVNWFLPFQRFTLPARDYTNTTIPAITSTSDIKNWDDFHGSFSDPQSIASGSKDLTDKFIDALPFAAVARIYRDYFLNQDLQTSTNVNAWFPADDFDFQLDDGANLYMGNSGVTLDDSGTTGHGVPLLTRYYRNWRRDYFTSATLWPQRGDSVGIPVKQEGAKAFVSQTTEAVDAYQAVGNQATPQGGSLAFSTTAQQNKNPLTVNVDSGFSIDDLYLSIRLDEWLRRNMHAKAQYNEALRVHFNDAPTDERLTKPYYIGGQSHYISVSQVLNTADAGNAPLGTRGSNANLFKSQRIGHFHSHEYGVVIGLASIQPDTSYVNQGIDRHFQKYSRYDYLFPEFANLPPQPIYNRELVAADVFGLADDSYRLGVFGYTQRLMEYRFKNTFATGALGNELAQDLYSWTQAREFKGSYPTLGNTFINGEDSVRHDAFAAGDTVPPFVVQFGCNLTSVRPIPYYSDVSFQM